MIAVVMLYQRFPHALEGEESIMRLSYLVVLASALGMSVMKAEAGTWRHKLRDAAIWFSLLMLLVVGYSYKDIIINSRIGAELFPYLAQESDQGEITLRKTEDGHFYLEALVNGYPVLFMIDTGASDIVLSPDAAAAAKINMDELNYTKIYSTANGLSRAAAATITVLQIGKKTFREVPVSVNSASMEHSLLGMTFLNRFGKVHFEGNNLTLIP
ncbi:MAG: TIGR02281 family clan AA aspartic protease [Rickettsiales bacterium]